MQELPLVGVGWGGVAGRPLTATKPRGTSPKRIRRSKPGWIQPGRHQVDLNVCIPAGWTQGVGLPAGPPRGSVPHGAVRSWGFRHLRWNSCPPDASQVFLLYGAGQGMGQSCKVKGFGLMAVCAFNRICMGTHSSSLTNFSLIFNRPISHLTFFMLLPQLRKSPTFCFLEDWVEVFGPRNFPG